MKLKLTLLFQLLLAIVYSQVQTNKTIPNQIKEAKFISINGICIYGFLKRPEWFIWFVGLLTLQQWYSHGSYAIELWQEKHVIYWISVGIIVLMPVAFVLLLLERRKGFIV